MRKNHISGKLKRILAVACAAAMVVTSVPANTAFATESTGSNLTNETAPADEPTNENQTTEEGTNTPTGDNNTDTTSTENTGEGKSTEQSSEGGSQTSEGGSQTSEGGSKSGESGSQTSEGGSQTSEGGSQTGEGGSQTSEGGSQTGEGGSQTSEGGSQSGEGGSKTGEGESQTGKGEEGKKDPEVKKDIKIDFGIDDSASVMEDEEYTKLVFKATAEDKSSLKTPITKIEYELINGEETVEKSGEIQNDSITIESKDLVMRYEKYQLRITATDAEGTTVDQKELKFSYNDPEVTINIDSEASETINEGTAYTKLVFGAEATTDSSTELDHFEYELTKGDISVKGSFEKGKKAEVVAQKDLPSGEDPSGEYTLKVIAVDKNEQEGSATLSDKVYLYKDVKGPSIEYTASKTSEDPIDFDKSNITYTITVTDESGVEYIKYAIQDKDGNKGEIKEIKPVESDSFTFDVNAPAKGSVWIEAKDKNENTDHKTTKVFVIEGEEPKVTVSPETSGCQKKHTLNVKVEDAPNEKFSGIQKVEWVLNNESGNKVAGEVLTDDEEMPKSIGDLLQSKEWRVEISETDTLKLNGTYTFVVTAIDWCGNPTTTEGVSVVFDNTPPKASLKEISSGIEKEGGIILFNKEVMAELGEDGVKATFSVDETNFGDAADWKVTYELDGEEVTADCTFAASSEPDKYAATVTLTKDGDYEKFKVVGIDAAGNEVINDTAIEKLKVTIDTSVPGISVVLDDENLETEYHKEGTAKVFINSSTNIKEYSIELTCGDKEPTTIKEENINVKDPVIEIKQELLNEICPLKEGAIELRITATTINGNTISEFEGAGIKTDTDEESGEFVGYYFYDAVAPKLKEVKSTKEDGSDPVFNIYKKDELSYVSENQITDTYTVIDKYIDTITISYQKNGKGQTVTTKQENSATVVLDGEGTYTNFVVTATDKAGNTIVLSDSYNKNVKPYNAATGGEGTVNLNLGKVLDTTAPTVEFAATKRTDAEEYPSSFDKANNIRYYKDNFKGKFTVKDNNNLDKAPIEAKLYQADVDDKNNLYYEDLKDVYKDSVKIELPENANNKMTIEKECVDDGIYHFYIEGTDKAGNKIETQTDKGEMGLAGYKEGFMSFAKVRDTVKPAVSIDVSIPTDKKDNLGNVIFNPIFVLTMKQDSVETEPYDPFQKVSKANITFKGDDPSLIEYSYAIVSTKENTIEGTTEKRRVKESKEYNKAQTVHDKLNKTEHMVTFEDIVVKDRAGNEQELTKSQPVIFDSTAPDTDLVAPTATVRATTDITYHAADGRALFKDSPKFSVTITDPKAGTDSNTSSDGKNLSSSGLKYYKYQVKVDDKEIDSGTVKYDVTDEMLKDPKFDLVNNLTYSATFDITVDKDKYQSNDMVIVIDAEDQAGNRMATYRYYFGIDSEGPKVIVTYDNNSAKNDKYFNRDRVATVTVIDRNINKYDKDGLGRVRIRTQKSASISSFSHTDNGGNGGNDTWVKTITYTKEGDYTLSLEGTKDALGNPAKSIDYKGKAPTAFTIDKTAPITTLWFDNNDARNLKYYNRNRTATVRFKERNFYEGGVNIETQNVKPGKYTHTGNNHDTHLAYTTDGDYTITVNCTDLAGNKAKVVKVDEFIIDKTQPVIKVEFNNNNVQNQKYYKDPRRATVTVTDHNFSPSDTRIETQVTPGGFSNTNRDIHIAYVDYNNDGNYTMRVTSTDLAGNAQVQVITVDEFVIDRTAPVITVTFDNNDAQNGKYYKNARTATVSVREHNFNASEVKIAQTADIQQGSVSAPGVGGFGGGGDDHSASIHYGEDGNYTLTVNYTDLAGNPAQEVRVDEFVIDQTPPTLKFVMPDETKGASQIFAGDIAPQIDFGDINMTRGMASISLTGMKANSNALNLIEDSFENFQGTVRYENLKKVRESDDIYTATAVVTDLAGNTVEKTITFSVNRFGSTYDYNKDEYTTNLVNGYYTNDPKDVVLREINVNQLKEHKLTLYKDGDNRTLKEGTDYSFEEKVVNGHYEYIYTIFAKNFEEEGNYNIIATSKDKANNTNSNSTVKGDDGSNEVPLRFAVDKTAPTNTLTGVDLTKNKFTEDHITIFIEPRDNMNAVASFVVRVTDRNGNIIQEFEISGKELAEFFEQNKGIYTLTIDQNNQWQRVEVITTDAAGNVSTDRRIEQNTQYEVLVTPNLFYQYINRLPLVGGSAAAVAGLIFFLLAKRRKKDEEEETAA